MFNRTALMIVCLFSILSAGTATAEPADWNQDTSSTGTDFLINRNFLRAASEVAGVHILIWSYDRYIRPGGGSGFRVGFNSWMENINNGFEWDDNSFTTNQFAHPYQGNLNFNAARSNGFSFWESVPFSFTGSLLWECLGEIHHPSMNDWIATSVGGFGLGEMLFRLSEMVFDRRSTGTERVLREVGGFAINPISGLNSLLDGRTFGDHPNNPERLPLNYRYQLDIGARQTGDNTLWDSDTTRAAVSFEFDYGDPFFGDMNAPYDHFDMGIQLNFGDKAMLGRVQGNGMLAGTFIDETENASHILAAIHHFDYVNSNQYEFGSQSIGASLLSRFEIGSGFEIRTNLDLDAVILGASSSDHVNFSGRDYDYGPGASAHIAAEFIMNDHHILALGHEQHFIHTVNGNLSEHHLSISKVRLAVPLLHSLSLGAEYQLMLGRRLYEKYPDIRVRRSELRLFATILLR